MLAVVRQCYNRMADGSAQWAVLTEAAGEALRAEEAATMVINRSGPQRSGMRGLAHRALVPPPAPRGTWVTACGWKYGGSRNVEHGGRADLPPPIPSVGVHDASQQ